MNIRVLLPFDLLILINNGTFQRRHLFGSKHIVFWGEGGRNHTPPRVIESVNMFV